MSFSSLLKKASSQIEKTYEDELILCGTIEIENEDGSTDVENDVVLTKTKCRLSVVKADNTDVEDINIHKETYKVFCNYKTNIKEGDTLRVNKIIDNEVVLKIEGIAAKPVIYGLAQEVLILNVGVTNEF